MVVRESKHFNIFKYMFESFNCAYMAADDSTAGSLAGMFPQMLNTFIDATTAPATSLSGSKQWSQILGVGGAIVLGMTEASAASANRCSINISGFEHILSNSPQLSSIDFWNITGQQVLLSSQACCACGGGTTFSQPPAEEQTSQGLADYYHSLNGPHWTYGLTGLESGGWLDKSVHFCMWQNIRCDGRGSLFSIVQMVGNVTGTIPSTINKLSTLRVLIVTLPSLDPMFLSTPGGGGVSGTLPSQIADLTSLAVLNLITVSDILNKSTHLSGTLPTTPPSLHSIVSLGPTFSGTIPEYALFDATILC